MTTLREANGVDILFRFGDVDPVDAVFVALHPRHIGYDRAFMLKEIGLFAISCGIGEIGIEIQFGSYLGEDDIVRFADAYGREEKS